MNQQQQTEEVIEQLIPKLGQRPLFERPLEPMRVFPKPGGRIFISPGIDVIERDLSYDPYQVAKDVFEVREFIKQAAENAEGRQAIEQIKNVCSELAEQTLFEFNDEITRTNFFEDAGLFLENLVDEEKIYDYRIRCDETNNPPEVVDNSQFVADIYIKPSKKTNYIQLNFVATRTGVSFDELVNKFLNE